MKSFKMVPKTQASALTLEDVVDLCGRLCVPDPAAADLIEKGQVNLKYEYGQGFRTKTLQLHLEQSKLSLSIQADDQKRYVAWDYDAS